MPVIKGATFYGEDLTRVADQCKEAVITQLLEFGETELSLDLLDQYALVVVRQETFGRRVLKRLGFKIDQDDERWLLQLVKLVPKPETPDE